MTRLGPWLGVVKNNIEILLGYSILPREFGLVDRLVVLLNQ